MKLTGEKVILRPIVDGDYLDIYESSQDANIALYNGLPFPYSQQAAKKFIRRTKKKTRKGKRMQMAILDKSSGKMVEIGRAHV